MSSSRVLKWFVFVMLLLTLGWKVVAHSYAPSQPDEKANVDRVADFLVRNHFKLVESRDIGFKLHLLHMTAPACRMLVALSEPRGWHRDQIRGLATSADRTFVVFGGKIYREQPIWLTVPDFLWSRFMSQLGFALQARPVISVVATPTCDAERLPWHELS